MHSTTGAPPAMTGPATQKVYTLRELADEFRKVPGETVIRNTDNSLKIGSIDIPVETAAAISGALGNSSVSIGADLKALGLAEALEANQDAMADLTTHSA